MQESDKRYPGVTLEYARAQGLELLEWEKIVERLGRVPNEYECSIFACLWGEEVGLKSSSALIATIPKEHSSLHQLAGTRLGIVDIGEGWSIVLRWMENNHLALPDPASGGGTAAASAIEELSAVGATPVALLNLLRFGQHDSVEVHRLFRSAVDGLSKFSNTAGVPTIGGELYFHGRYNGSMMVNCVAVGLLPSRDLTPPKIPAGSVLVYAGADTGADGLVDDALSVARRKEQRMLRLEKEKREQTQRTDVNLIREMHEKDARQIAEESVARTPNFRMSDPFLSQQLSAAIKEAFDCGALSAAVPMAAGGLATACFSLAERLATPFRVILDRLPVTATGFGVKDLCCLSRLSAFCW